MPVMPAVAPGENGNVGGGDYGHRAFLCKGGLPCDDVFCSEACRAEAMAGGHRLICPGGSEEGRQARVEMRGESIGDASSMSPTTSGLSASLYGGVGG